MKAFAFTVSFSGSALVGLLLLMSGAIASAQTFATKDPLAAAKVMSMTGQVSVMRDAQPWALQVGDEVQMKQVIVTGEDGFAVFQVSDGSSFEVYPNSTVTFRSNPANWRDLLDVWLGRVKVKIQHLNGQPNPNRIQTPTATISVRGTVFDVAVEDEDDTTLIVVDEGQVAVQHRKLPYSEPKIVSAGEYLRVSQTQPLAQSTIDRGRLVRKILDMLADAAYTAASRRTHIPTSVGGGGGGLGGTVGDTCATTKTCPGGSTGTGLPPIAPPPPPPPPGD